MEQPQLPDLKKKDKERKKAGAMWNGFGNGASPFQGAAGGAAARSAASAAAQGVASAGARGVLATIAALLSGKLGTVLAMAIIAGVGLVLGYGMLFGRGRAQNVASAPALGALESTITVERPQTSRALDWLARSAQGELKFDPAQKAPEAEKKTETAENTATAPADKTDWNGVLTNERPMTDRMAHDLSGAKLSTQLGGNFGGKNVFASADGPKFGGIAGNAGKFDPMANGRTSAMNNGKRANQAKRSTNTRSRSPRAIGQLKFARTLSNRANLATSDDAARTRATDAFDGKVTSNDDKPALITPIKDGVPTINPNPSGGTTAPPETGHKNETPYQGELEQARKEAQQAGQMQMMGLMMLALGAVLIMIGAMQVPVPNIGLIMAGIALMAAGAMMLMMAMMQKQNADKRADKVAEQEGQTEHGKSTKDCINEAYNNGGQSNDSCSGSGKTYLDGTHVQEAARKERESTYHLENGQPISQ